jgi:hypothetical protein
MPRPPVSFGGKYIKGMIKKKRQKEKIKAKKGKINAYR